MWKNYFKTALRQLAKRKLYTSINIIGLSAGILSFMVIGLYIYHHLSYDRQFEGHERIFRINQEFVTGESSQLISNTPSILSGIMAESVPEVASSARLYNVNMFGPALVKTDGENQTEEKFAYVDESFFELFPLQTVLGDPYKALASGEQLVITRQTAERYFEKAELALGNEMTVGDNRTYTVGAVIENLPDNFHLDYDFFGPFKILNAAKNPEWFPSNYTTYVRSIENVEANMIAEKLNNIAEELMGPMMKEWHFSFSFMLEPLTELHFGLPSSAAKPTTSKTYLYIFAIAALLILIIATINYVNLATAESSDKMKEVGIRKVMGAYRSQLIFMYMAEAAILVTVSLVPAYLLLHLFYPAISKLTGALPDPAILSSWPFLLVIIIIAGSISILAGFYPSWVIAKLEPIQSIKSRLMNSGGKRVNLRRTLVVFQFCVSMFMIMATAIIYSQLNYIQSKKLGYEQELVLSLPIDYKMRESIDALKTEMLRSGAIKDMTISSDNPTVIRAGYRLLDKQNPEVSISIKGMATDHDVAKTLGLQVVAGRDLESTDYQGEGPEVEYSVLLNEAAVTAMGISTQDAIGRRVDFGGRNAVVKGVVGDFHFNSLHENIEPLCIFMEPSQANLFIAKLNTGDVQSHLAKMEYHWKNLVKHRPFEFQFLEDKYNSLYEAEVKISRVFVSFSILAILIACLGLFGMVSFVANKKSKEISIRKVLGADSWAVLKLLSREFIILLAISAIIASAIGYYFSDKWLSNFAFKVDLPIWIYLASVSLVVIIAMLTIWYKSWSAANQNPINNLKSE